MLFGRRSGLTNTRPGRGWTDKELKPVFRKEKPVVLRESAERLRRIAAQHKGLNRICKGKLVTANAELH